MKEADRVLGRSNRLAVEKEQANADVGGLVWAEAAWQLESTGADSVVHRSWAIMPRHHRPREYKYRQL